MFTALPSPSPGSDTPVSQPTQGVTCIREASTLLEAAFHQVWCGLGAAEFANLPLCVWAKLNH